MFKNAFRLPFKLLGIPLFLDITFLIILPVLAWLIGSQLPEFLGLLQETGAMDVDQAGIDALSEGMTPYLLGLAAALALFASVVIHELGHAITGRAYGVETERITLWLLGGMAHFREMPRQKGAEAVVAIAGPITSGALGALVLGSLAVVPTEMVGLYFVLIYTGYMNILLAVFNMIPALPLDGGRVLRSLLHLKMSRLRATQISASISKALAIALGLFGLLAFNLFLILIAFFVYIAVNAEAQYAIFSDTLSRFNVDDLMTSPVESVDPDTSVDEVRKRMLSHTRVAYPIKTVDGEFIGQITLDDVQEAPEGTVAKDAMSDSPPTISSREQASELFERMIRDDNHRLLVTDDAGYVVGIITKTDLMRAIQIISKPRRPSQRESPPSGVPRR